MAPVISSILLLTTTAGVFAQDPLKHAGEDCFLDCWKTPGFCEGFCGAGNACCKRGDADSDPNECKGPLTYLAQKLPDGTGANHECVKAAYLPGQAPVVAPTHNTAVVEQAQCIGYMAQEGCGWTNKHSCPNQPVGWKGTASPDSSIAYKCCCTNNLWTQDATQGEVLPVSAGVESTAQCKSYMVNDGCGWTSDNSCPDQPRGKQGVASNDGSLGFKCCCANEMWKTQIKKTVVPGQLAPAGVARPALNAKLAAGTTAQEAEAAEEADGLVPVVAAQEAVVGAGAAVVKAKEAVNPDFMYNHEGGNVRVERVSQTDPEFNPSEHHGPIHNALSMNNVQTAKERCQFGICADLEGAEPTAVGGTMPVAAAASVANGARTLPSYSVSVEGSDKDPALKIDKFEGNGSVVDTIFAGGTTAKPELEGAGGPPALNAKMAGRGGPPKLNAKMAGGPPKLNAKMGAATGDGSSSSGSSMTSSGGSSGSVPLWALVLIIIAIVCVIVACVGGIGSMFASKKKGKQRGVGATDREAYLKNDFIERQPVYEAGETDPMMKEQEMVPMQPTESFPVQVEPLQYAAVATPAPMTLAPLAPMTAPSGVSFPGMPTIGSAAPVTTSMYQPAGQYQYAGMPQTTSMPVYTSPSTYLPAASAYSQAMPMTAAPAYSQAGSQFVYR